MLCKVVDYLFLVGPPEYVAGPVNGHLYAQVDKAFKKKVRSLSLDSGAPASRGAEQLNFFENRANTLTRRNAYGFQNKENAPAEVKLSQPRLQYPTGKMEHPVGVNTEIKSIDKLLQELGECSELLDTTLQQAQPSTRGMESSHARAVNGGSRSPSVSPPGVPVRKAASFDAGSRYNRKGATGMTQNGVDVVRQGQYSSTFSNPMSSPPFSQNYSWNTMPRAGQVPNGYPTEQPRQAPPSFTLHEAPLSQISPPLSPLSPKFYATQMMPRTFKATTVTHTTVGYNPPRLPSDGGSSSDDVVTNGVLSITDEWTGTHAGKQRRGPQVLDFNNNKSANGVELFDLDERKEIEDSGTLPEKGNVKSKIALLTDMFQPNKLQPAPHHQNLRCQIIPMPGLTSVSASEVFKEISNYNAKSLAPGELSHSSGTLYSSKAPPRKIIEPSKHVASAEPPPEDIDILAVKDSLKHVASAHEYLVHDHKPGTFTFFIVTPSSICVTHIIVCHV